MEITSRFNYANAHSLLQAQQDANSGRLFSKTVDNYSGVISDSTASNINADLSSDDQKRKDDIDVGAAVAWQMAHARQNKYEYTPTDQEILSYLEFRKTQDPAFWGGLADAIISWPSLAAKGVSSMVSSGDILNPVTVLGTTAQSFIQGTESLGNAFQMIANDEASPLNSLLGFKATSDEEKVQNFRKVLMLQDTEERILKEGRWFAPEVDMGLFQLNLYNKEAVEAGRFITDITWLAGPMGKATGISLTQGLKNMGRMALSQTLRMGGEVGLHNLSAYAAVKSANIGQYALRKGLYVSEGIEKVMDKGITTVENLYARVAGVEVSHIGNGIISPTNMNLRAAIRGSTIGATVFQIPMLGTASKTWLGAKVTSTILHAGSEALDMVADAAKTGERSVLSIAERLEYQSANSGVRVVGAALNLASPIGKYAKNMVAHSFQGGMYGGGFGYFFGGEEGFYNGIGVGIGMGGSMSMVGGAFGMLPSKAKSYENVTKHFEYVAQTFDSDKKQGVARLLNNIEERSGADRMMQTMGEIAALHRFQKDSKIIILTEDKIKAMASSPEYIKETQELLSPEFGGITFKRQSDGTTVMLINADTAADSVISGEMFHAALMNTRYGLMFKKQIRDALIGSEDELGALTQMPLEERVEVMEKFRDGYMQLDSETGGGNQTKLLGDFNKAINELREGKNPSTLNPLLEEFSEAYFNRWLSSRPIDYMLNTNILNQFFRGAISKVKDIMAVDLEKVGGRIDFNNPNGPDGYFLTPEGNRIKIPALDRVMKKLVADMRANGEKGFPLIEKNIDKEVSFLRGDDLTLQRGPDGKVVRLTEEQVSEKMSEAFDGILSRIKEIPVNERGLTFRASNSIEDTDINASYQPTKKRKTVAAARKEAQRRIEQARRLAFQRTSAEKRRILKEARTEDTDVNWDIIDDVMGKGSVKEGDRKYKFSISGNMSAKERSIFEEYLGKGTTKKLVDLLWSVTTKGADKNNVLEFNYETADYQRANRDKEGRIVYDIGNERYGNRAKVRRIIPHTLYMSFERGKRTQQTVTKKRGGIETKEVNRTFKIKGLKLYIDGIDVDALDRRQDYAMKHARMPSEGFNASQVRALWDTPDDLQHDIKRLLSNYSIEESPMAGADFFGGGREGREKRDIVNAIIGFHPSKDTDYANYPLSMQMRGGNAENPTGLNEAHTVFTTMRVDRINDRIRSLDGEGFYYNNDRAYELSQRNYQPKRTSNHRNHEGDQLAHDEYEWTLGSAMRTPTGEPFKLYMEDADYKTYDKGFSRLTIAKPDGPHKVVYLNVDKDSLATASSEFSAFTSRRDDVAVYRIAGKGEFYSKNDNMLIKEVHDDALETQIFEARYQPARKLSDSYIKNNLTPFLDEAIERFVKKGRIGGAPFAMLADLTRAELEQFLKTGTVGVQSKNFKKVMSLRAMDAWDNMIDLMKVSNQSLNVGINKEKLNKALAQLKKAVGSRIRTSENREVRQEAAQATPLPFGALADIRQKRSYDEIVKYIASHDIYRDLEGIKIPDDVLRKAHEVVTKFSLEKDLPFTKKVTMMLDVVVEGLREDGQHAVALKLQKAINNKVNETNARLKENVRKMISDRTVSYTWREVPALKNSNFERLFTTDLTGHYIQEVQHAINDSSDMRPFMELLKQEGREVREISAISSNDLAELTGIKQKLRAGDFETKDKNFSDYQSRKIYVVYGPMKGAKGKVPLMAFSPNANAEFLVPSNASRPKFKKILAKVRGNFDFTTQQEIDTAGTRTQSKMGFDVWVPQREANGEMTFGINTKGMPSFEAPTKAVASFVDMVNIPNVPFLGKLKPSLMKTEPRYVVYRPHGSELQIGNETRGTSIKDINVTGRNIRTSNRLFTNLTDAKAYVLNDIVDNHYATFSLNNEFEYGDGLQKQGVLRMIASQVGHKFPNVEETSKKICVFRNGDYILITARNSDGTTKGLSTLNKEDLVGLFPKKQSLITGFKNYAQLYRYDYLNNTPSLVAVNQPRTGRQFKSEADVRAFFVAQSKKSQIGKTRDSIFARLAGQIKEWQTAQRIEEAKQIGKVLTHNPRKIRELNKELKVIEQPLEDIKTKFNDKLASLYSHGKQVGPSEAVAVLFDVFGPETASRDDLQLKSGGVILSKVLGGTSRDIQSPREYFNRGGKLNASIERQLEYLDVVQGNMQLEMRRLAGYLDGSGTNWRDYVKDREFHYLIEERPSIDDTKSRSHYEDLKEAFEEGRKQWFRDRNTDSPRKTANFAGQKLASVAEAYAGIYNKYDEIQTMVDTVGDDKKGNKLKLEIKFLDEQFAAARGGKNPSKKKGLASVEISAMTPEEFQKYEEIWAKKAAEYESLSNIDNTAEGIDRKNQEEQRAERVRKLLLKSPSYLPREGENFVTSSMVNEFANTLNNNSLLLSSEQLRSIFGSGKPRNIKNLFYDKKLQSLLRPADIDKSPAESVKAILNQASDEVNMRDTGVMADGEKEVRDILHEFKMNILDAEGKISRLDDSINRSGIAILRFSELSSGVLRSTNGSTLYPLIKGPFSELVSVSKTLDDTKITTALNKAIKATEDAFTKLVIKPIEAEASQALGQLVSSSFKQVSPKAAVKDSFITPLGNIITATAMAEFNAIIAADPLGTSVRSWIEKNVKSKDERAFDTFVASVDNALDGFRKKHEASTNEMTELVSSVQREGSNLSKEFSTNVVQLRQAIEEIRLQVASRNTVIQKEVDTLLTKLKSSESLEQYAKIEDRVRRALTNIDGEIVSNEMNREILRNATAIALENIEKMASNYATELDPSLNPFTGYRIDSELATQFPETFDDLYSENFKARRADITGGAPQIELIKKEAEQSVFRRNFGVSEIELYDKARKIADALTQNPNWPIKKEHYELIKRYMPKVAEQFKSRIELFEERYKAREVITDARAQQLEYQEIMKHALASAVSNQQNIQTVLNRMHGKVEGEKRFGQLQNKASAEGRSMITAEDLFLEEQELLLMAQDSFELQIGDEPAAVYTPQELLEGKAWETWLSDNRYKEARLGRQTVSILNSVFKTPEEHAAWAALDSSDKINKTEATMRRARELGKEKLAEKQASTSEFLAGIEADVSAEKNARNVALANSPQMAEIKRQQTRERIRKENEERIQNMVSLFKKMKKTDTATIRFRNKVESFFNNREEARNNLLTTNDENVLFKVDIAYKNGITIHETPNKRYTALTKQNGSVQLMFNGYGQDGVSVLARHLGTFPDMERAQVALRFANDDLARAVEINKVAAKTGQTPPPQFDRLTDWTASFLEKNNHLLSPEESSQLALSLSKVGNYPETAWIELKGLGRKRSIQIYPAHPVWNLLHNTDEYAKGTDGVWRRTEFRQIEKETRAQLAEIESQTPTEESIPVAEDTSTKDNHSRTVDDATNFTVEEEMPIMAGEESNPIGTDWAVLKNKLNYTIMRIQSHKNGKWITSYRVFNPAAGMIAERNSEEEASSEIFKDVINGNK